jgi:hypothetical protein
MRTDDELNLAQYLPKLRRWITFLQDHYLSGDDGFLKDDRNARLIRSFRTALRSVQRQLGNGGDLPVVIAELRQGVIRVERHFINLETDTSFLHRAFWLIWVLPFAAWTIYVAIVLEEWGQLIAQAVVLSRTLSLGVALLRYKKSTGWIIFKFYEDRILGGLISLILYTRTLTPASRHLHGDWRYTVVVGVSTCLMLHLLSFWRDFWIWVLYLRLKMRPAPPPSVGEARTELRGSRDALLESNQALMKHIETADISDRMKDHFLLMKRDTDRLLQTIGRFLPVEDAVNRPHYHRLPKVAPVVFTAIVQAQALGASYRYPWLMAETAGWGIWNLLRMVSGLIAAYVSLDDMGRLFSNIVGRCYSSNSVDAFASSYER